MRSRSPFKPHNIQKQRQNSNLNFKNQFLSTTLWGVCKEQVGDHISNFNPQCMSTITDYKSKTSCYELKELSTFYSHFEANNPEPHYRAIESLIIKCFKSTNDRGDAKGGQTYKGLHDYLTVPSLPLTPS